MAGSQDRLVRRIQRRQLSIGPDGPVSGPSPRDVMELEARARRLRALGDRFTHVRLSPDVARPGVTETLDRVRGVCVATEA